MKAAYYNEYETFAAAWLRNLIAANLIAPGEVDERSIVDVQPDDVRGFTQCHFFAGIAVWSLSLRKAGWGDDRAIWTGSCPCQGFSVAGNGKGFDDERHLWPDFFRLIRECRPAIVAGEQVASPLALAWLDLVQNDLEGEGYAVGAADLCAASVGAPHIRQRLYWMANHCGKGLAGRTEQSAREECSTIERGGDVGGVANTPTGRLGIDGSAPGNAGHAPQRGPAFGMGDSCQPRSGRDTRTVPGTQAESEGQRGGARGVADQSIDAGSDGRMANPNGGQPRDGELQPGRRLVQLSQDPLAGFWRGADWLACTDGKARPTRAGLFPLADGVASRVGKLRAAGNALCAPQAQEFIKVLMECLP